MVCPRQLFTSITTPLLLQHSTDLMTHNKPGMYKKQLNGILRLFSPLTINNMKFLIQVKGLHISIVVLSFSTKKSYALAYCYKTCGQIISSYRYITTV